MLQALFLDFFFWNEKIFQLNRLMLASHLTKESNKSLFLDWFKDNFEEQE